jgi:hypothetical protein
VCMCVASSFCVGCARQNSTQRGKEGGESEEGTLSTHSRKKTPVLQLFLLHSPVHTTWRETGMANNNVIKKKENWVPNTIRVLKVSATSGSAKSHTSAIYCTFFYVSHLCLPLFTCRLPPAVDPAKSHHQR